MREKIKSSTGIIIIFAVAVIVFGGAYTWANLNPPVEVDYTTYVPVTTTLASQTKDWKTHENTNLGFSFKYPKEWTDTPIEVTTEESMGTLSKDLIYKVTITDPESKLLIDCANNEFQSWSDKTPTKTECTSVLAGLTESEKSKFRGPRSPKNIYVRVYKNPSNIEIKTWLTNTFKLANTELSGYEVGTAIEMAGVSGHKSSIGCCAGVDNNYVIAKDDYIYSLGTNYFETSSLDKTMPDYFLKIAKTFKFI